MNQESSELNKPVQRYEGSKVADELWSWLRLMPKGGGD